MSTSSMKIYLSATDPSVRVPFREVALSTGERIRLYDTSGPYTDPGFTSDVKQGLPPLRRHWILSRNDVEPGAGGRWGLRAKPGSRVTQMHYARRAPPDARTPAPSPRSWSSRGRGTGGPRLRGDHDLGGPASVS